MCNGVNAFMRIVEFCNSNSGFISAVLATLSFVLSAVAIFISVQTSTHQAQISLLEKRFDIYSKIQKICSFIEKFPAAAQDKSYIGRCSLACAFLYPLGTKEYNICQEINAIKKCAISAESLEAKKTLEKEWMNEADKLFEFCAIEMRNNLELQNSVHLLYSPDIEKCVKKLLSIYESFQLGHVYFTNEERFPSVQGAPAGSAHAGKRNTQSRHRSPENTAPCAGRAAADRPSHSGHRP